MVMAISCGAGQTLADTEVPLAHLGLHLRGHSASLHGSAACHHLCDAPSEISDGVCKLQGCCR